MVSESTVDIRHPAPFGRHGPAGAGVRHRTLRVVLPAILPAPEGGSFAVTELGGYCFSEKPRSLPAADKTCRYDGGAGRHGTANSGHSGRRWAAPAVDMTSTLTRPASDADDAAPGVRQLSGRGHPAGQFAGRSAAAPFTTAAACACSRWAAAA